MCLHATVTVTLSCTHQYYQEDIIEIKQYCSYNCNSHIAVLNFAQPLILCKHTLIILHNNTAIYLLIFINVLRRFTNSSQMLIMHLYSNLINDKQLQYITSMSMLTNLHIYTVLLHS